MWRFSSYHTLMGWKESLKKVTSKITKNNIMVSFINCYFSQGRNLWPRWHSMLLLKILINFFWDSSIMSKKSANFKVKNHLNINLNIHYSRCLLAQMKNLENKVKRSYLKTGISIIYHCNLFYIQQLTAYIS